MNCLKCGEALPPAFAFCEACGTAVNQPGYTEPAVAQCESALSVVAPCKCGSSEFNSDGICENCGRHAENLAPPDINALNDNTAGGTHRGRHHAENQDALGIIQFDNMLAMAVADGVSTACRAKEAANTAVSTALAALSTNTLSMAERLGNAVLSAHTAICALDYDDTHLAEPQATLVLAAIEDDQLHMSWVGDSRLYVVGQNGAALLTEDDSWLNQQLQAGIALSTAMMDSNAHCITQCLGMRDADPEIHYRQYSLGESAMVILCSDGLWNYCETPTMLQKLLDAKLTAAAQCENLIRFANLGGGHDNISVILHHHLPAPLVDTTT